MKTTKRCKCPKCRLRYENAARNRAAAKARVKINNKTNRTASTARNFKKEES